MIPEITLQIFNDFLVFPGDENWGGQCALGRRQSPIDLAEDASVVGVYPSLSFINYSIPIQNAKVKNTGHSREFNNIYCYSLYV